MNAVLDRRDWRPGGAMYGEVLEFLYGEAELLGPADVPTVVSTR